MKAFGWLSCRFQSATQEAIDIFFGFTFYRKSLYSLHKNGESSCNNESPNHGFARDSPHIVGLNLTDRCRPAAKTLFCFLLFMYCVLTRISFFSIPTLPTSSLNSIHFALLVLIIVIVTMLIRRREIIGYCEPLTHYYIFGNLNNNVKRKYC